MLERLDRQVAGALDRRALIDAQQFLEQMMNQGQGKQRMMLRRRPVAASRTNLATACGKKITATCPARNRGKTTIVSDRCREFRADTRTQVKGQLAKAKAAA